MTRVFLWGPLCDAELRTIVLAGAFDASAARLDGYTVSCLSGLADPVLVSDSAAQTDGLVLDLPDAAVARLDLYAAVTGNEPMDCTIEAGGAAFRAQVYLSDDPGQRPLGPWDAQAWQAHLAPATRLAARDLFALAAVHSVEALQVRYPMLLSQAASIMRAGQEIQATDVRRQAQPGDVISRQRMVPYTYFFAVQVDDLQFRRFDGSLSPVVRRAGFVMADAVTILPYDPVRDVVMVIEQFRYGPFIRGAQNCWVLEPIAGRIDAGEEPVDAALREMAEEARLTMAADNLIRIGASYPSPGATSEILFHFIALCDLPQSLEGVAGLESEAEDIRSHILPLDRLLAMVETGEAQNGPLIQSAYWLALNRARLQAG